MQTMSKSLQYQQLEVQQPTAEEDQVEIEELRHLKKSLFNI
jgi:hypothetical protein